jgi:large subunit ribosomal protein L22
MAQATAQLRYLQIAPRKVRLVASALRGLHVLEAEAQLLNRSKRASEPILKLLRSAVSNAKNAQMDVSRLVISKIAVDRGPMLKRLLPRAMGRGTPIHKIMSHVVIVLSESDKSAPAFTIVRKEKAKKPAAEKPIKPQKESRPKPEIKGGLKEEKQSFFKRIFKRTAV